MKPNRFEYVFITLLLTLGIWLIILPPANHATFDGRHFAAFLLGAGWALAKTATERK